MLIHFFKKFKMILQKKNNKKNKKKILMREFKKIIKKIQ